VPQRAQGTPSCRRDGAMLHSGSTPAACSSTVVMPRRIAPGDALRPPFRGFVANAARAPGRRDQDCVNPQSSERCACARQTTVSAAP
jgi:hypothetical protein